MKLIIINDENTQCKIDLKDLITILKKSNSNIKNIIFLEDFTNDNKKDFEKLKTLIRGHDNIEKISCSKDIKKNSNIKLFCNDYNKTVNKIKNSMKNNLSSSQKICDQGFFKNDQLKKTKISINEIHLDELQTDNDLTTVIHYSQDSPTKSARENTSRDCAVNYNEISEKAVENLEKLGKSIENDLLNQPFLLNNPFLTTPQNSLSSSEAINFRKKGNVSLTTTEEENSFLNNQFMNQCLGKEECSNRDEYKKKSLLTYDFNKFVEQRAQKETEQQVQNYDEDKELDISRENSQLNILEKLTGEISTDTNMQNSNTKVVISNTQTEFLILRKKSLTEEEKEASIKCIESITLGTTCTQNTNNNQVDKNKNLNLAGIKKDFQMSTNNPSSQSTSNLHEKKSKNPIADVVRSVSQKFFRKNSSTSSSGNNSRECSRGNSSEFIGIPKTEKYKKRGLFNGSNSIEKQIDTPRYSAEKPKKRWLIGKTNSSSTSSKDDSFDSPNVVRIAKEKVSDQKEKSKLRSNSDNMSDKIIRPSSAVELEIKKPKDDILRTRSKTTSFIEKPNSVILNKKSSFAERLSKTKNSEVKNMV